jgi:hypothetical protein
MTPDRWSAPELSSPAQQLQWLVDRAAIHDLMVEYGHRIDVKDFVGMAELFTDDGAIELPFASFPKATITEPIHTEVLSRYSALQHQYTNLAITIEGDTAWSRSYFDAVHVHDALDNHGDVGGSYETTYRRVDGSWRLVVVRVHFLWTAGQQIPGAAPL